MVTQSGMSRGEWSDFNVRSWGRDHGVSPPDHWGYGFGDKLHILQRGFLFTSVKMPLFEDRKKMAKYLEDIQIFIIFAACLLKNGHARQLISLFDCLLAINILILI